MNSLTINAERSYEVIFGADWREELSEIVSNYGKVLLLSPKALVESFNLNSFESEFVKIFVLPDGEDQKNAVTLEGVWKFCADFGLTRSDAIVGIGGGATTDLSGFAAATWLRGIDWFAIPTSIAGMVDAAIGGKSGINTPEGKNLVGAFHSPSAVIIDFSFLKTLPIRDYNAGMAEVIKCGFIADPKILELLLNDKENIEELIYRSVAVKANVVSDDFKEGRLREILNYGHTLGHAIEKRENYKWRHGEAIAIGLVFAAELSRKAGLSQEAVNLHRDLLGKFDLKIAYDKDAFEELLLYMAGDKKNRGGQIRFIGLSAVGKPHWFEDLTSNELREVYERIFI